MISGTKQKIIDLSLELFSQYGYSAVTMEQIAQSAGIKAPSLYKHFKGKQDIFDSIFALMDEKYQIQIEKMNMHLNDGANDLCMFQNITEEELQNKVMELVSFSIHDEYNQKFRKLLTTHQYSDERIGQLYTERYVNMLWHYHQKLFEKLIEAEVLIQGDAEIMALQYVSVVYTLIGICDREPQREAECIERIRRHLHQFNRVYRVDQRK